MNQANLKYKINCTLSRMPPWPGKSEPESLTSATLLMNDSIKSPNIDAKDTINEINRKCLVWRLSKVIKDKKFIYESISDEKTLKKMPPLTPSQVLFGEILGQNKVLPNMEPINKAPLSVYQAEISHIRFNAYAYLY